MIEHLLAMFGGKDDREIDGVIRLDPRIEPLLNERGGQSAVTLLNQRGEAGLEPRKIGAIHRPLNPDGALRRKTDPLAGHQKSLESLRLAIGFKHHGFSRSIRP